MSFAKLTWQCLFSPRLYKTYFQGAKESVYEPKPLEKWNDKLLLSAQTMWNMTLYATPFMGIYLIRRGFLSLDEVKYISKIIGSISCIMAISYLLRAVGRASNEKYIKFLNLYHSDMTDVNKYFNVLRKFDFEFDAWPVNFSVEPGPRESWFSNPFNSNANADMPVIKRSIVQLLGFFAVHTFGLRMIYPGSLGLINHWLWEPMLDGRSNLVEMYNGVRAKLLTSDGNTIDTMFVDNRKKSTKGETLVICCEGNAGFYEVGIVNTPIEGGYSVLGWNHPGFGSSTGSPYPKQEQNAIDAVMQYGISLGFKPDQIVLFGWSIGGYTASWVAVNYPEIKGLVLDATFDDLLPLAQGQMPPSWANLVKEVVRSYVDLHIAELVVQYKGPITLVRRTDDEMICLRQGHLSSNRGNYLAIALIKARHAEMNDVDCLTLMHKYIGLTSKDLEAVKKKDDVSLEKCFTLMKKYMKDFKATHCTPLPKSEFDAILSELDKTQYKE